MNPLRIGVPAIFLLACLATLWGCGDVSGPELEEPPDEETPQQEPPAPEPRAPNPALGKVAFVQSCAGCHPNRDGFDLAFFGFTDADIVRRGVAHVDTTTARDIVAYIRSLDITPLHDAFRPFQPGAEILSSDVAFAVTVFGEDRWPAELTPEELLALVPGKLPTAVSFPLWSDEHSESDWMPNRSLPEALLDAQGGRLREALEAYHAARNMATLLGAVAVFEELTRRAGQLCEGSPGFHSQPLDCFEARRWMASLTALHLLQQGDTDPIPLEIVDLWWAVGDAQVSRALNDEVGSDAQRIHRQTIAASWLMLSWVYDPLRKDVNELYLAEFLKQAGFQRLAAFTGLYWMAVDPEAQDALRSYLLFLQVLVGHRIPPTWYFDAASWGYRALQGYVDAGIRPKEAESWTSLQPILEGMQRALDVALEDNVLTADQHASLSAIHQELQGKLL